MVVELSRGAPAGVYWGLYQRGGRLGRVLAGGGQAKFGGGVVPGSMSLPKKRTEPRLARFPAKHRRENVGKHTWCAVNMRRGGVSSWTGLMFSLGRQTGM